MLDILKGVVITILSIIIWNAWDNMTNSLSYPTPKYENTAIIPIPVTRVVYVADGTYMLWQSYEEVSEYNNPDYSYLFRDKFIKEHKVQFMDRGDSYSILEYKGKFAKIEIVAYRDKALILKAGDLAKSGAGWIKV